MRITLILTLGLLLAACGNGAASAPPAASSVAPTTAVTAQTAASATTNAPAGAPIPPGSVEAKVAQALGTKIGATGSKLALASKDATEWPDSALGCPAAGMMYSQIVTPGFKLTYTDGAKTYEVHTDQSGEHAVLCENKQPTDLSAAGQ